MRHFAIAAFLFTAAAFAASSGGPALPRNGDFLSEPYLAALERTRSHHAAWNSAVSGPPQEIRVSRDKRGLVLDLVINWHEGTAAVFDALNPGANLYPEGSVDEPFTWIDATRFQFGSGKDLTTYRYIGNEQTYLRTKLLAGSYADAKGRRYSFTAGGEARFPGHSFRYEIYTDMVFESGDLFTDRDATERSRLTNYGFAWKGKVLYLYRADCWVPDRPDCVIDRKKPLAVLHKLPDKD